MRFSITRPGDPGNSSSENVMWKTRDQIISALETMEGVKYTIRSGGASPYSSFDLIVHPAEFRVGVDPGEYKISSLEIKSVDPAKAYKGRHGVGRLIHATPSEGGIVEVDSNIPQDQIKLVLECGTMLGHPPETSETLGDWFSDDQVIWSSEWAKN
jgi:hypothetical protein